MVCADCNELFHIPVPGLDLGPRTRQSNAAHHAYMCGPQLAASGCTGGAESDGQPRRDQELVQAGDAEARGEAGRSTCAQLPIRCVLSSALRSHKYPFHVRTLATNRETHSATAKSSLKLRRSQRRTDRLRVHACCLWPCVHVCVAIHGFFFSLSQTRLRLHRCRTVTGKSELEVGHLGPQCAQDTESEQPLPLATVPARLHRGQAAIIHHLGPLIATAPEVVVDRRLGLRTCAVVSHENLRYVNPTAVYRCASNVRSSPH